MLRQDFREKERWHQKEQETGSVTMNFPFHIVNTQEEDERDVFFPRKSSSDINCLTFWQTMIMWMEKYIPRQWWWQAHPSVSHLQVEQQRYHFHFPPAHIQGKALQQQWEDKIFVERSTRQGLINQTYFSHNPLNKSSI